VSRAPIPTEATIRGTVSLRAEVDELTDELTSVRAQLAPVLGRFARMSAAATGSEGLARELAAAGLERAWDGLADLVTDIEHAVKRPPQGTPRRTTEERPTTLIRLDHNRAATAGQASLGETFARLVGQLARTPRLRVGFGGDFPVRWAPLREGEAERRLLAPPRPPPRPRLYDQDADVDHWTDDGPSW
jgi:hypothetical protein